MSQASNRIIAAAAVMVTLGAAQFASGRDLAASRVDDVSTGINRSAKTDRLFVQAAAQPARTVSVTMDQRSGTSILIRMAVDEARSGVKSKPSVGPKSSSGKTAVACEPPVSVLTEVAKLLQPGRCVT